VKSNNQLGPRCVKKKRLRREAEYMASDSVGGEKFINCDKERTKNRIRGVGTMTPLPSPSPQAREKIAKLTKKEDSVI